MAFNNEFTQVENSWAPAGTSRPNTFTGGNKFISPSTTSYGILVQGNGTISGDEPSVVVNANVSGVFQGAEKSVSNTVQFISNQFHNALAFYRSNGTYATKTGILANNSLVQMLAYGWDNVSTYRIGAGLSWSATEAWSGTACGTQQAFFVVPNGTTSIRTAVNIRNDGVLEPGYGIRFGSTGLSVLSTYEEGTFTPGIRSTGATFSLDATETVGRYTRIGKMVFVEFAIQLSGATTGTLTNQIFIQNLPFTPQVLGTKLNWRPVLAYEGFTVGYANGGLVANLTNGTEFAVTSVRDNTTMGVINGGMFTGSGARICGGFSFQVA